MKSIFLIIFAVVALRGWANESEDHHSDILRCKTVFHEYHPSPFEQKWIDNVEKWQADVCKHTSNDEMNWWIGNTTILIKDLKETAIVTDSGTPPVREWSYIFSIFTYKKTCMHKADGKSSIEFVHIPIEPTASIARDPRKCWSPNTETWTQSKEYLLPLSFNAAVHSASKNFNPAKKPSEQDVQVFLFDAGATLSGKTNVNKEHWSGTEWIYDWYAKRGITFDHVYAWEPKARVNEADLTPAMAKALKFFNVGINDGPTHEHNPLHRIRTLCKPKDIVVFKLDIDHPMELNVVKQLLSDPELMNLVDDFFYEHHVTNELMRFHGLVGDDPKTNLKSWYDMAIPARKAGFHMHFWP